MNLMWHYLCLYGKLLLLRLLCADTDPASASPIACGLGDEHPTAILHRLRAVSSSCSAPQRENQHRSQGVILIIEAISRIALFPRAVYHHGS